jgi:hypothetical protein
MPTQIRAGYLSGKVCLQRVFAVAGIALHGPEHRTEEAGHLARANFAKSTILTPGEDWKRVTWVTSV